MVAKHWLGLLEGYQSIPGESYTDTNNTYFFFCTYEQMRDNDITLSICINNIPSPVAY